MAVVSRFCLDALHAPLLLQFLRASFLFRSCMAQASGVDVLRARYFQATDGPVQFRPYHGMDKWDFFMQNRDAKLLRDSLGAKAAKAGWWDSEKKTI
jgi:hypothetical protein